MYHYHGIKGGLGVTVEDIDFREKFEMFIVEQAEVGNRVFIDPLDSNNEQVVYVIFNKDGIVIDRGVRLLPRNPEQKARNERTRNEC